MNELLPCPFCGFQPYLSDDDCCYPATRSKTIWSLNCYEAGGGCGAQILGDSIDDCISKWNTRTVTKVS